LFRILQSSCQIKTCVQSHTHTCKGPVWVS